MKKKWLIGGALLALMVLFAGCSPGDDDEDPNKPNGNLPGEGEKTIMVVTVPAGNESLVTVKLAETGDADTEAGAITAAASETPLAITVTETAELFFDSISLAADSTEQPQWTVSGDQSSGFSTTMPPANLTITVVFKETPSDEARLSGIAASAGKWEQEFNSDTLSYTLVVDHTVDALTLTPACKHQAAKAAWTNPSPLSLGPTTAAIEVTAQDGTTKKTYTVNVIKLPDPSLTKITIRADDIDPAIEITNIVDEMQPSLPFHDNPTPDLALAIETIASVGGNISAVDIKITDEGNSPYNAPYTIPVAKGATKTLTITVKVTGDWTQTPNYAEHPYTLKLTRPLVTAKADGGDLTYIINDDGAYDEVHVFIAI